ncbi:thioredoxin [Amycolatopsis anabasis]|uniref:thioredoxin n=1 Tax=Amycolatopsis anabasis TaxID=1840409 RepID=UPI002484672E|nr:thioredoxin [Amycolatopsis anabasis]
MIIDATDEAFADLVLNAEGTVLVEFWATWCPPCRMLAPVLEEIATELADVLRVVKVDVDTETATARAAQVLAMPTLHVYVGGELVKTMTGAAPKARLLRELTPHLPQLAR